MAATRRLSTIAGEATASLELPDGPLVVALSGGADSAALAFLVAGTGRPVRAVHVDHGLGASALLREAAASIAQRLRMDLQVIATSVDSGPSPEGQARRARYEALASVAEPCQVLTAHTADDNLETVLFNLVRGTGTRGLAGIPPFRPPNVHRPMLAVRRSVAREIAGLAGLPFADDPMNLDPLLSRNHLRRVVIPRLTELNPGIADAVTRASALVRADADLLDQLTSRVPIRFDGDAAWVAAGALRGLPGPIAGRVVLRVLEAVGAPTGAGQVARVLGVAAGEASAAELGRGVVASRSGAMVRVGRLEEPSAERVVLEVGETRHAGLVLEVARHASTCLVAPQGAWSAIFPITAALQVDESGVVFADGEPAWKPGVRRLPVAWYEPGTVGYLSVLAREESGWTSSP